MKLKVKRLPNCVRLPVYGSDNASGLDLYTDTEEHFIAAGARKLIPTGVCVELPEHTEGQIRPRSSSSLKGLDICLGTIDNDYRGELMVIVSNTTSEFVRVLPGTRLAQLVICPLLRVDLEETTEVTKTKRGSKGFGSTGK